MPPPEPPLSALGRFTAMYSDQGEAAPWDPQRSRAIPFRSSVGETAGPPVSISKYGGKAKLYMSLRPFALSLQFLLPLFCFFREKLLQLFRLGLRR